MSTCIKASATQKTVVLIQDDSEVVSFIKQSKIAEGYALVTLSTGKEALEQVGEKTRGIDLVILDHLLPDMSGLEVLRTIKSRTPMIPVIYTSAYGNEDVVIKAFRYGACDFLRKPFNSFDLLSRMDFFTSQVMPAITGENLALYQDHCLGDVYQRKAASGDYSYKMQLSLTYINENYTTKLRLNDVARVACMSEFHFSRVFKRQVGITFQDYVNKCRIDMAKKYLRQKGAKVIDVAFAVGYEDLSNFIHIFKKVTGLTPSKFAKSEN